MNRKERTSTVSIFSWVYGISGDAMPEEREEIQLQHFAGIVLRSSRLAH